MLRSEPEGSPFDIVLRGGYAKLRIDEILLDVAPEEPGIVILFRDIEKPSRLYRFRMEISGLERGLPDSAICAGIICANFIEAIEGGPGMRGGSPDEITKIEW